ncbi:hypothetical protein [Anaerocolumna sp. MB42-C2]|uniref:hypothetical protein n=1 Tax=Anaerocolumna sp. MB42-C2 TaxID=3070997 RepID=UPI0027DF2D1E|nr:hypothetical protein [Anaerocolumna sp. MB42-C2]WMJ85991.1 hypothetical protein RBU59_18360 [Anaerocolumna sp. MB42-C2]
MRKKGYIKNLVMLLFIFSLLTATFFTKTIAIAESSDDSEKCISTVTYNRITDLDELIRLAITQANEKSNNRNSFNIRDEENIQNNGILATQLIKENTYSDGSIEKEYVIDNMALENTVTGDVITYVDSSLYKSLSQYNVVAVQTVYYTLKYYESGVPGLYNDILVRAKKEQSYVNYSTTPVAYIKHGIIASLMGYPFMDTTVTNGTPGNGKKYTTSAKNSSYYKDDSTGNYCTSLYVRTGDNDSFELTVDLLEVLDG